MQPGQLARCIGVVVHPQVGEHTAAVVAGTGGEREDGGALPTAGVAAGGIPGENRCDQTVVERLTLGAEPRRLHRLDHLGPGQDVALDRVGRALVSRGHAAGPRGALLAGEGGRAGGADRTHLALGPALVRGNGGRQGGAHLGAGREGVDQLVEVGHAGQRLGGHGPDTLSHRGHHRPHGEELAGDGDTPGVPVPGGDREGHADRVGAAQTTSKSSVWIRRPGTSRSLMMRVAAATIGPGPQMK